MDPMRKGQRWILDAFIGQGGFDVLHPEAAAALEEFGYNSTDFKRVFSRVKSTSQVAAAWSSVAAEAESRARYWQSRGARTAALGLYERAALLFGRTHYSFYGDDPRRVRYLDKLVKTFQQVIELSPHAVSRVVLPFEGKQLHGVFEHARDAMKQPCVICLPGMDMFKEDWHVVMRERILPRGWVGFSMDGPGQGESLTRGLKMTIDNYDRALSAVIDWLVQQPQVDPERIVLIGSSMGSWWGARCAAAEPRLKAVSGNMAALGDKMVDTAQPSFLANLAFMTGITDVEKLHRFIADMTLADVAPKVKCPYLVVVGENDELTTLESTRATYERFGGPKELWVYEREFHPLGPTCAEWLDASLDWLGQAMEGRIAKNHQRQLFITKSGQYIEGSGEPPWWNP
jgi:pimeloyl-ACP methyl ester carboxylesterase